MIPVRARPPRRLTIEGARPRRVRLLNRPTAIPAWLLFLTRYGTPLLLVALALTVRAAGSNVLVGDVAVARIVQGLSLPGAADFARAGYWIGATPVTMGLALIAAIGFGAARQWAEALFFLGTIAARCLNPLLKAIIDSPRPSAAWVRIREDPSGLGFPSSHAMGVVIFFGASAYLAHRFIPQRSLRLLAQGFCLLAIVITGFGRVYTGAHWPTDVLGGYLYGLCLLLVAVAGYRLLVPRSHQTG